eukprot:CAMPEP_0198315958 /NCGR_PEP_ID=MMETSP1450-20131203/6027_1 /TAXON_ID=753684 ORGANISM="Madagascaria erythrocladiodes, Strain CCMP3234" /NCGR_SAMPLE_ID=MMETSP1450 /ASSEMBLY_ACC=CAM_ASM_001115 /LENGTH=400 /DNA_ID=CAMNT_0044019087 /DNA_START=50 /DNA_END=1249 /DNA_ORIENTATION=+
MSEHYGKGFKMMQAMGLDANMLSTSEAPIDVTLKLNKRGLATNDEAAFLDATAPKKKRKTENSKASERRRKMRREEEKRLGLPAGALASTYQTSASNTSHVLHCRICDVHCPGREHYDSHAKGKKHLKKAAQLPPQRRVELEEPRWIIIHNNTNNPEATTTTTTTATTAASSGSSYYGGRGEIGPTPPPRSSICEICHVDCQSPLALQTHLVGVKHRRAVVKAVFGGGEKKCEICDVSGPAESLKSHFESKGHQKKFVSFSQSGSNSKNAAATATLELSVRTALAVKVQDGATDSSKIQTDADVKHFVNSGGSIRNATTTTTSTTTATTTTSTTTKPAAGSRSSGGSGSGGGSKSSGSRAAAAAAAARAVASSSSGGGGDKTKGLLPLAKAVPYGSSSSS